MKPPEPGGHIHTAEYVSSRPGLTTKLMAHLRPGDLPYGVNWVFNSGERTVVLSRFIEYSSLLLQKRFFSLDRLKMKRL